ncbi:MAG: serine hydrolase [Verrucomicrobiales bacterium]
MSSSAENTAAKPVAGKLQGLLHVALQQAEQDFAEQKLHTNEIAITIADVTDPEQIVQASHRGNEKIYPASVIKMFYMEAAHRWMEQGKIADTPELRRAMRDMIVESYNEATHYVVDLLTGTTGGPELPPEEMAEWSHKRNAVNRYFEERGYQNINANQKPWGEGPYGRERAWVGQTYTNRNMLTTDATARLLTEIATLKAVTPERSKQMLELMKRDPFGPATDPDDQSHGFTGPAVPKDSKLWSKAGWTSQTRHDAAYVELPSGRKVVLVIFTVNHANERNIIPAIARVILEGIEQD